MKQIRSDEVIDRQHREAKGRKSRTKMYQDGLMLFICTDSSLIMVCGHLIFIRHSPPSIRGRT